MRTGLARLLSCHRRAMARAGSPEALANVGLVLAMGHALGLALAYLVGRAIPVYTGDLDEARQLGVVSLTVLTGYPKGHEWRVYLLAEFLVVVMTLGIWWVWCIRRSFRAAAPQAGQQVAPDRTGAQAKEWDAPAIGTRQINLPGRSLAWAVGEVAFISLLIVYLAFDINRFGGFWRKEWAFLSEEGMILGNLDSLLRGNVLYRDEFTPYGPLLFYPVKWVMQLLGPTALTLRIYFFVLDCLGFLLLYFLLRRGLGHRGWTLVGLGFFLLNFSMPYHPLAVARPSAHQSVLRFSLGLAWLPIYFSCPVERHRRDLIATGMLLGLPLIYSPEVGAVSLLTFLILWLMDPFWTRADWRRQARHLVGVGAGLASVLILVGFSFAVQGVLLDALGTVASLPNYAILGFLALRFPALDELVRATVNVFPSSGVEFWARQTVKAYWIPWMLSVGGVILGLRLLLGRRHPDDRIALGLLLVGGMLFRRSIWRPDLIHFQTPLVPTVILGLMLLRWLCDGIRSGALPFRSVTAGIGLLACLGSALVLLPPSEIIRRGIEINTRGVSQKFRSSDSRKRPVAGIPRAAGIRLPAGFADEFEATVNYIRTHTAPYESIIAFPNGAAYHFFADRPSASRFSEVFLAGKRADRLEVLREWQAKKVRYIIYSLATWRLDGIPEHVLAPELYEHILQSYRVEVRFGNTLILKRRDA